MTTSKLYTLIFVKNNHKVLLGYKTRGLGVGLWNGFGGKVEQNESILNCAKRELLEECQINANKLDHIGVIKFEVENDSVVSFVHVFTCDKFSGAEMASEEMNPIQWYNFENVPFDQMWPDSKFWFSTMLRGEFFSVHCVYNRQGELQMNHINSYGSLEEALKIANF